MSVELKDALIGVVGQMGGGLSVAGKELLVDGVAVGGFSFWKPKPIIIGLYGPSGAGKTHLLDIPKKELGEESFALCDGSKAVENIIPGTMDDFKRMS